MGEESLLKATDKHVLYMDNKYLAWISNYFEALPLAALLGLASVFLGAGFLAADFLAKDTFLVADFFVAEAFLAGAFLTAFLAVFLGALGPT